MQVRRTKAEWDELVAAYRESGQTMRAFCKAQGLHEKTLGNYVRGSVITEKEFRSIEEWTALIDEQKTSGQSLAGWCRERGIKESSMKGAMRRLKTVPQPAPSQWIELNPGIAPPTGVERQVESTDPQGPLATKQAAVTVSKPERAAEENSKIRIRGSGLEIEVDAGYSVEKLAILIEKLVK